MRDVQEEGSGRASCYGVRLFLKQTGWRERSLCTSPEGRHLCVVLENGFGDGWLLYLQLTLD